MAVVNARSGRDARAPGNGLACGKRLAFTGGLICKGAFPGLADLRLLMVPFSIYVRLLEILAYERSWNRHSV